MTPPRRVLGSPFKSPESAANDSTRNLFSHQQSPTPARFKQKSLHIDDVITEESDEHSSGQESIVCPICSEGMVSLLQLNQHIDDVHGESAEAGENTKSPRRKSITLDLLDNNRGFTLSPTPTTRAKSISRAHWKQPSSSAPNKCEHCSKLLNVKNGIVNCRKCGGLFCNKHTNYRVRLSNTGQLPRYDSLGVWSRCCKNCFINKPDLKIGTDPNFVDMTSEFARLRKTRLEVRDLARDKLKKKFIKLVNLMAEDHLHQKQSFFSFMQSDLLIHEQKQIVGEEYWADDSGANCSICFVKFNVVIRKHHCRLCGIMVCDDAYGERKNCSIKVPLAKLIDKLPNLNYSLDVRQNWNTLLQSLDSSFSARCCKNCKDELIHEWKLHLLQKDELSPLFNTLDQLLAMKRNISVILARYKDLVEADQQLLDPNINKLRTKAMSTLKDFEVTTANFTKTYYTSHNGKLAVKEVPGVDVSLINNIHNGSLMFLQDNLLQFKEINQNFKQKEKQLLSDSKKKQKSPSRSPSPEKRLTKKQIREFREQLMVMNEQKYLVENLINDMKKQRKFDELKSLVQNKQELENTIESLERQLGEFAF